jgi:ATP-dependent Lon protease
MSENIEEFINEAVDEGLDVVVSDESMPEVLDILPIVQRPILPGITVPVIFTGSGAQKVVKDIWNKQSRFIGVTFVQELQEDNLFHSRLYPVGTALRLLKIQETDDGVQVLARAVCRVEKRKQISRDPVVRWKVRYIRDAEGQPNEELKAYTMSIISGAKELLTLNPLFQEQLKLVISNLNYENPGLTMDLIAALTTAGPEKTQDILAAYDLLDRGKRILELLKHEIDVSKIQENIKQQLDAKVSEHQKEFFLREQLKIIKKELGIEKDERSSDLDRFNERISKIHLSEEAKKVVNEEMNKLSMLEIGAPEYHVTRNWLDWVTELPWGMYTDDHLELKEARTILDTHHFGLDDVKERIVEYIATMKKRGSLSGSILCLVGPPGVGKTSIGKSVADAVGRKFFRFSLGGMRDEAEIKGHRRTYIGAMPGKLIQSLKRTGSANPVIMLDEIDKIGASYQGDPASALLEVLDPEQNSDFLDHYLDLRFDLSKILFITTANTLDSIPAPLLDRMEVIRLSGYLAEEKVKIAQRHLIPNQLKAHGLKKSDIKFPVSALRFIIGSYAREAGVRNLENMLKRLMRRVTRYHAEGDLAPQKMENSVVQEILGPPPFQDEELYSQDLSGVVLGLAWTSLGGATLYIEAISHKSDNAGFKLTGKLGEVMNESAQLAYTYVRKLLDEEETQKGYEFFKNQTVHLHVPEGATPKDGPSAGITMALAIYSLAVGRKVDRKIAMTGELTITGRVLAIGGVREKIVAARRAGIRRVILPQPNQRDYENLPDFVKKGMQVRFASQFQDVLDIALKKGN